MARDVAQPDRAALEWFRGGSGSRRLVLVLAGTAFLAACAWIEVPMLPVPMTMQTFAVVLIGAVYGWRLGGATVAAYLAEGAVGLPVFAGGAAGAQHLIGPTGGYLFAFVAVAAAVGWCAERGLARNAVAGFAVMLAGHLAILALGVAWLATFSGMGLEQAVAVGATPFVFGMVLKSALAAACLRLLARPRRTG
ncbi:MAG: biotin transporter BioY [Alphaproteobacteria bacterium]